MKMRLQPYSFDIAIRQSHYCLIVIPSHPNNKMLPTQLMCCAILYKQRSTVLTAHDAVVLVYTLCCIQKGSLFSGLIWVKLVIGLMGYIISPAAFLTTACRVFDDAPRLPKNFDIHWKDNKGSAHHHSQSKRTSAQDGRHSRRQLKRGEPTVR